MRTVHESAYKPQLTGETKFIVNIRPISHNGAALSSTYAAVANNNKNATHGTMAANRTNADLYDIRLEAGAGAVAEAGISIATDVGAATRSNSKGLNQHYCFEEMKWRRICTVSSLIVAFLLISGSIYLHLRQEPHLGRLHHGPKTPSVQSKGKFVAPI